MRIKVLGLGFQHVPTIIMRAFRLRSLLLGAFPEAHGLKGLAEKCGRASLGFEKFKVGQPAAPERNRNMHLDSDKNCLAWAHALDHFLIDLIAPLIGLWGPLTNLTRN